MHGLVKLVIVANYFSFLQNFLRDFLVIHVFYFYKCAANKIKPSGLVESRLWLTSDLPARGFYQAP